ncbi:MAG: ABC transporter substrate-binding protein [Christensenellales bacterium]|jgi:glycine betaine/proline transport system substrate-binding protein
MKKTIFVLIVASLIIISGCSAPTADRSQGDQGAPNEKTHLTFADVGWDSIRIHNAIAGLIAEEVFGYTWDEISGSTPITSEGVISGSIDVHMEMWTDNLATYPQDVAEGRLKELSINFDDNFQGLYVPRYVIEGDPERGLEALAPGLNSVADLKDYAHLFPDPEDRGMGRIFGGLPGWEVTEITRRKVSYYGLDEMYNYVEPGSDAAMSAAMISAWDKGEPIVAYYWEPTWLLGMYDFVLLEDAPYNENGYFEGETAFPAVVVTVCVSNDFYASNPDYCDFLKNYRTSSALTSQALAYMQETGAGYEETAKWFLIENSQLIDQWLDAQQAETLRNVLN